jgi:outer membrane receptor for ferrienterochelin and colicins
MRKLSLLLLSIIFSSVLFSQNPISVAGRVFDRQTSQPLQGATVVVNKAATFTLTGNDGSFTFRNLSPGKATLIISHIGFETAEITIDVSHITTIVNIGLSMYIPMDEEIVVSASKRAEKIVSAPASIHIIGQKELQQFSGSNVYETFFKVPGLEVVRLGVDYISINARGFNKPGNNKFFQFVDGRNIMSAVSTGVPLYNLASWNKEDAESIEIVLGPQAALYGPNVHNGLVYITTKDPRKYQGTTVAVSAGNRYQFSSRFRHATKIDNKWALKLTGEYVAGKDFEFFDSVYAGNNSFYGPVVGIPERNVDFDFRHVRGEAYGYYSLATKTDIIISGGGSENNLLGVTNNGRNQMRGVRTGFLQARIIHPDFFVTIYNSWGNIGNSYAIPSYTRDFWNRTHSTLAPSDTLRGRLLPDEAEVYALRYGNRFRERNQRLNGEAQYNHSFNKAGLFLVAGLSYQKDKPYSFGYSMVDKFQRIYVTQYGIVAQLEKVFQHGIRFTGSIRYDHHSNYEGLYSPKLALIKKIGKGNFRITWGKAYAVPAIFFQYANFSGLTFGNGPGIRYVPDGTKYPDQPGQLPPTVTMPPLKPEEIGTWETGYKGRLASKIYLDISLYYGNTKNFLSTPQAVSGRIISVGDIPVEPASPGTIDTVTRELQGALFNTFFNYGKVSAYGMDAGLYYTLDQHIDLSLKYSWFGSDISKDNIKNDANKDGSVLADEKSYNAPKHRMILQLGIKQVYQKKIDINIAARYTDQYDFYSGNQIGTKEGEGSRGKVGPYTKNFDWGPLGGFTVFDLSASYRINEMTGLNLNITNLFNVQQREFVGSPPIGRLIMMELKIHLPGDSKR